MFKNVATKVLVYAWDTSANNYKTGDAANLTLYVSKDGASFAALGDTSATELDSTNNKGAYVFDVTAGETNADDLTFGGKSSTANIIILKKDVATFDLMKIGVVDFGTAQAVSASTMQLKSTSPAWGTNTLAGHVFAVTGVTQAYPQFKRVLSNTSGAGGTVTFDSNFTVTPSGGNPTYIDFGIASDAAVAAAMATITNKLDPAFSAPGVLSAGALVNSPAGGLIRTSSVTTTGTSTTFVDSTIPETGVNKLRGCTIHWTGGANVGAHSRVVSSFGTSVTIYEALPAAITSGDTYKLYHDAVETAAPDILARLPVTLVGGRISADVGSVAGVPTQLHGSSTQEIGGP